MPPEVSEPKKRNAFKILMYSLSVAFLLAGVYYLYANWERILMQYVEKKVLKESGGLYHIKLADLKVNLFSGHLNLKNLELIPDTTVYNKLLNQKKAPDNLFHLRLKELNIQDLSVRSILFSNKLDVDSIVFSNPDLTIISKKQPYNQTDKPVTIYQLTKNVFKEVHADRITFYNTSFIYINKNSKESRYTALRNLNVQVNGLLIDSLSGKDSTRFYSSKNIALQLDNYRIATPDSLYFFTIKGVSFSTSKRQLIFNHIALKPRYNKIDFYRKTKVQKDRYDLMFNQVLVNHIDLQRLGERQELFSSSTEIRDSHIEVYNNNAYPDDLENTFERDGFPHQQLQKLALTLKIDTLNLNKIDVIYAEADRDTKRTGAVSFNQTGGKVFNVTNDSLSKIRNPYTIANLHTRFLNQADLKVNFKFNLKDPKGAFQYSASLGALNGTAINQVSVPLGLVEVTSADIQGMNFQAEADNYVANGRMKLYYKNLKIGLLKSDDSNNQLEKRNLLSALANTFVINSNNPRENGEFVTGLIHFERPVKLSFFNFLWKSLLTGIKSSAGLGDHAATETDNVTSYSSDKKETSIQSKTDIEKPNAVRRFIDKVGSFLGLGEEKHQQQQKRNNQTKPANKQEKE